MKLASSNADLLFLKQNIWQNMVEAEVFWDSQYETSTMEFLILDTLLIKPQVFWRINGRESYSYGNISSYCVVLWLSSVVLPALMLGTYHITLSQKFIFNFMYFKHHLPKLKIDIFITHYISLHCNSWTCLAFQGHIILQVLPWCIIHFKNCSRQ